MIAGFARPDRAAGADVSVNAVRRVQLRRRKIRDGIDALQQVPGDFAEVVGFADPVDVVDEAVQNGFDFAVGGVRKKRPLALQPVLMADELFTVEIRDLLPLLFSRFHGGGLYLPLKSTRKFLPQQLVDPLRIGAAACGLHGLTDEKAE